MLFACLDQPALVSEIRLHLSQASKESGWWPKLPAAAWPSRLAADPQCGGICVGNPPCAPWNMPPRIALLVACIIAPHPSCNFAFVDCSSALVWCRVKTGHFSIFLFFTYFLLRVFSCIIFALPLYPLPYSLLYLTPSRCLSFALLQNGMYGAP